MRWEYYQFQQPIRGQTWGQVISLDKWEASLPRIAGWEELFCQGIAISEVFTKLLLQLRGHCLDSRGGCVHHDRGQKCQHQGDTQQTGHPAVTRGRCPHVEPEIYPNNWLLAIDSHIWAQTVLRRKPLILFEKLWRSGSGNVWIIFLQVWDFFFSNIHIHNLSFTIPPRKKWQQNGHITSRDARSDVADILLGNVLTIWQNFWKVETDENLQTFCELDNWNFCYKEIYLTLKGKDKHLVVSKSTSILRFKWREDGKHGDMRQSCVLWDISRRTVYNIPRHSDLGVSHYPRSLRSPDKI